MAQGVARALSVLRVKSAGITTKAVSWALINASVSPAQDKVKLYNNSEMLDLGAETGK